MPHISDALLFGALSKLSHLFLQFQSLTQFLQRELFLCLYPKATPCIMTVI